MLNMYLQVHQLLPHLDQTSHHHMCNLFRSQLTRVRSAGAKDLRAGSHTPQDRLDHLYPFRIVDWHIKRSFLKVRNSYIVIKYTCRAVNFSQIDASAALVRDDNIFLYINFQNV